MINEIKVADKQTLQREAALVALKRQAEWHDLPTPSAEEIQLRIQQVNQYDTANDATLIAMKDVVIQHLSMRLQIRNLQNDLTARTLWARLKRLFRRSA